MKNVIAIDWACQYCGEIYVDSEGRDIPSFVMTNPKVDILGSEVSCCYKCRLKAMMEGLMVVDATPESVWFLRPMGKLRMIDMDNHPQAGMPLDDDTEEQAL